MLTLPLDLYPLSLLFDEAVVVGAETELVDLPVRKGAVRAAVVERKTQLFMQHILRQVSRGAALPVDFTNVTSDRHASI